MIDMMLANKLISRLDEDLRSNKLVLPALPEVAMRARAVVENTDSSAKDIAKVVADDPAISAKLLKVANSAVYSHHHKTENLQNAIARMGVGLVKMLITNFSIMNLMNPTSGDFGKRLKALHDHSIEVAIRAYVIAEKYDNLDPHRALLAGLIHDIGYLPMLQHLRDDPEIKILSPDTEAALRGLHTAAGKMIMLAWKFPDDLAEVVTRHEDMFAVKDGEVTYLDVVMAANIRSYVGTKHPLSKVLWSELPIVKKLGLKQIPDEEEKQRILWARALLPR